jgi:hypothetical protein
MIKKYFTACCFIVCFAVKANAQNVSSPYSILGIGDIENNEYGRYSGSGSAAVSRREPWSYNSSNPASLTALPYKTLNFDFGLRGKVSKFKLVGADTLTAPSKDFVIKRVTLAFKVTQKTAFAFGIKPFSTVNFQYTSLSSISDGDAAYLKYTEGTGGINQVYFSIANEIKKRLSVGVTASWLFGSLQNSIEYYNPALGLDIVRNESNFYNAAGLQAGLQYYTAPAKNYQHTFGLTATAYTKLQGEKTSEYVESGATIKTISAEKIQFKMPISISGGYSIAHKSGISFHLQGDYNKWTTTKLNYKNTYIKDAYGLHAGFEYSKKIANSKYTWEKFHLAMGVRMEQSYLVLNNNHLNDFAVTLGAGKNISRFISVNTGLEIGKRGSSALSQIQENYYQFNVGFTLKQIWFGTRKTGRYN